MQRYELAGKRFGRLTVIEKDAGNANRHSTFWRCRCDCGNDKIVATSHLLHGTVKSCGCLRKEQAIERFIQASRDNVTHGEAGTSLYDIWHLMKQRCGNPNNPAYKWYGAKGVRVCDEWVDFKGFSEWAHNNGYRNIENVPRAQRLSIDRIDSNGDYCPENCRWITVSENTARGAKARWENAKRSDRSTGTALFVSVDGV